MKNISLLLLVSLIATGLCSFTAAPLAPLSPEMEECTFDALSKGGAYILFAKKYGGEITKKQMEGQRKLEVDGCAAGSRIFTYTLEITCGGKTRSYSAESNELTDDMIAGLKALKAGDGFEFKKTKAYLPNGKDVVDVHGRKFVVV